MKKEKIITKNNKTFVLSKPFTALAITPNGQTVVGLTSDGYLYIWNVLSGELETLFKIEEKDRYFYPTLFKCSKMCMSHCGSFVVIFTVFPSTKCLLLNLKQKSLKRVSIKFSMENEINPYDRDCPFVMILSKNDDFFLLSYKNKIIQFFFSKNKKVSFATLKDNEVSSFAINSKNYYLLIGSNEGNIFLYSFQPKKEIWKIEKAHSQKIVGLCFTKDTKHIISAGEEGEIKLWDFHTAKYLYSLYSSSGKVRALSLTANGIFLIITLDKKIVILNLDTKEEKEIEKPTQHLHYPLMTAHNNSQLVIQSIKDGMQVYDLETSLLEKNFFNLLYGYNNLNGLNLGCGSNSSVALLPLAISADSNYFLTVTSYQQIILWNIKEKKVETIFIEDEEAIGKVTITPNNEYVIASTINLFEKNDFVVTVNIYDVESSLKIASFEIEEKYLNIVLLRVTPDNKYLILILEGGFYLKFDLDRMEYVEKKQISCHEYDTFAHTISLDGSLIAYGMKKNWENTIETIELYDNVKNKRMQNIKYFRKNGGYDSLFSIVISEDNRYIEFYANKRNLFCWDREKELFLDKPNEESKGEVGREGRIRSFQIAPNKRYGIYLYEDESKGLLLWNLEKKELIDRLMIFENQETLLVNSQRDKG